MEAITQSNDSAPQNIQPDKKVMKSKTVIKPNIKAGSGRINVLKKLDLESAKLLAAIKDKINKKSAGRKIKDSEIIGLALKQLNTEHIKTLQQMTYQEKDLLQLAHEDYVQVHGRISLNQYLGLLIRGEIKPPIKNVLET